MNTIRFDYSKIPEIYHRNGLESCEVVASKVRQLCLANNVAPPATAKSDVWNFMRSLPHVSDDQYDQYMVTENVGDSIARLLTMEKVREGKRNGGR